MDVVKRSVKRVRPFDRESREPVSCGGTHETICSAVSLDDTTGRATRRLRALQRVEPFLWI
jgi:hypothetical protein